jgi:transcriptional regulator with PAS, ATPase and Fis domain
MSYDSLIYGRSRRFAQVVELADGYAASPWPVLILGETGVGKELVAQRVHRNSPRRGGPFVPINCGAMPPSLFESELFGYEKGAFSGAVQSVRGLLRSAHGGTVFFDEVGDLEPQLQVKLLRFMDSGEIRAVGGTRVERADVRIVAATNVDLPTAIAEGRFRHDLLERLSVLTVVVPSLRERSEDILLIAKGFFDSLQCEYAYEDLQPLAAFSWPGNVRQLKNVCVRAAVRTQGKVTRLVIDKLLDEEQDASACLLALRDPFRNGSLEDIEKEVIVARLKQCQGNRKKTARELGIAKSTLHEKLRRWKTGEQPMEIPVAAPLASGGGGMDLRL